MSAEAGTSTGAGAGGSGSGSGAATSADAAPDSSAAAGPSQPPQAPAAVQGRSRPTERTLADVMRAPSMLPPVVVLDGVPAETTRKEILDPKEDLWLSTADGRYNSPIIPLNVGEPPQAQTFYVHKHILLKSEYFEKALCGEFRESNAQIINLPEENPAIFHFLVAYLYEGKYNPIKPVASVLVLTVPDQDKGKGKEGSLDTGAESDSDDSAGSDASDFSVVSRRRRERRRRREDRHFERMRQKRPGVHRPGCGCPQCLSASGPPCWHCQAPRSLPQQIPMPPHPGVFVEHRDGGAVHIHTRNDRARRPRRRHGGAAPAVVAPPAPMGWHSDPNSSARISGEDLRTWLLAYELNIDVYIMADKFLLEGFKTEIARATVDMLETAGPDAAVPQVLALCKKLYEGLPENDPLLKMIFARVAFLQPWRRAPDETQDFLLNNAEVSSLLLREMAARREEDINGRVLPSMERPWFPPPGLEPITSYRPTQYHPYRAAPPRW
ncbi:hypothetical protein QBC47DRAFT_301732 [Echria macrotheca]|uniref:BTB domain-containing protein n=1 Tax=Echria macrotheca TaxID=438768 RepID=A0AAJ0F4T9_9PEZI|nr:hypothetical protein QBC47DRAFT_301732 [Echria macrotheca]